MKESSTPPRIAPGTWFWVWLSASVAVLGLAAVWVGVSVHFRGLCSWMLVVVAVDAALMMRLAGLPSGRLRLGVATTVALLTLILATLLVSAAQIGLAMGVPPQEALPALSPGLLIMYLEAQLSAWDALWLVAGALVLARLAR